MVRVGEATVSMAVTTKAVPSPTIHALLDRGLANTIGSRRQPPTATISPKRNRPP
jgi:hypothetical protein